MEVVQLLREDQRSGCQGGNHLSQMRRNIKEEGQRSLFSGTLKYVLARHLWQGTLVFMRMLSPPTFPILGRKCRIGDKNKPNDVP